jgi:CBS-domain-containing membrane protein
MLALFLFVDSLSQAALAAALGSSVIILFVNPSSHAATPRSVIGGHGLALVLGSLFAVLLFAGPVDSFLDEMSALHNLGLALSVGLLILAMAVTDTEHPPAAGTVLGLATRPWEVETVGIIIGAVLLLAAIQRLLRSRLRDLM